MLGHILRWGAGPGSFGTLGDGMEFFGSSKNRTEIFPWRNAVGAGPHEALLASVRKVDVKVFNKKRVVSYDFKAPSAMTRDAEVFKADLVIGADGIGSIARLLVTGQPDAPRDTGDVAYRILISGEKLLADPELADLITDPGSATRLTLRAGALLGQGRPARRQLLPNAARYEEIRMSRANLVQAKAREHQYILHTEDSKE
ncbi:hypothetical protein DL771_011978 [Monosporascus sp. 5C6A]|nr:hypothetical protein DL771_011978 [Monosporascus sp. 5C6A]